MNISKVKFKIPTKEKLAELIFNLRDTLDENDKQQNANPFDCIFIDIPDSLKKKLVSSQKLNNKLKKEIIKCIPPEEKYLKNPQKELIKLKNSWNEVESVFFKEMKKYFGEKLIKKEYICYITNYVVAAYFKNNEITTPVRKNINSHIRIAEEILHLIYWNYWSNAFNKKFNHSVYDGKIWSPWNISEIIPEYILIENPILKKFSWHKEKREYPFIPRLRKILDPLWKNKNNMRDFLIQSHKKINSLNKSPKLK